MLAVLVAAALPAPSALAGATGAGEDVPVYSTQMPAAITLNYSMRQGGLVGAGDLVWRPSGAAYEASLEGRFAGFRILTWRSVGRFDSAGIAPERFSDQRRGKDEQAALFQRQQGKIVFSGAPEEYPLRAGAQDRLSWMIQIAAIAAADPKRVVAGARVVMYVAGARGDAEVWAFQGLGHEAVRSNGVTTPAMKLIREPRRANDTRVEVWLAPSLHHLPVRARLSDEKSTLEFLLRSTERAT